MALTATGDASARDRFDLDAEDEANSIVRQRLDAAKSIRVRRWRGILPTGWRRKPDRC